VLLITSPAGDEGHTYLESILDLAARRHVEVLYQPNRFHAGDTARPDSVAHSLADAYMAADAITYPSLYEGFGLPVLEALACGAIVVASGTTATAEAAGEACVAVDPADVASIAEGLRAALEDQPLRAELRSRAPGHVARFSWDACAERMVAVYRSALAR
jgi:glycosyltransferase involved in cell wall biosynthesis